MSSNALSVDVNQLLKSASVPALPQSAVTLLRLSQDPDVGPAEFAVPVESDPGLASQVLKFVNSAYFGFSREISSVRQAITLVGIRTIRNFALWSAVFSLMPNPRCGPFELRSMWQDSLRRAIFAREVARRLGGCDADETFSAALLQDLAIPILAKEYSAQYAELLEKREGGHVRLSQLERELLGTDHAEVGARIAGDHWKLPETTARLIANHTAIEEVAAAADQRKQEMAVALSALLPSALDESWVDLPQMLQYFGRVLPVEQLPELLQETDQVFEELAPLLQISKPARSLSDIWQQSQQ